MLAVAPFLSLQSIWTLADITNALMALPNLIAVWGLRKVVVDETKAFFAPPAPGSGESAPETN